MEWTLLSVNENIHVAVGFIDGGGHCSGSGCQCSSEWNRRYLSACSLDCEWGSCGCVGGSKSGQLGNSGSDRGSNSGSQGCTSTSRQTGRGSDLNGTSSSSGSGQRSRSWIATHSCSYNLRNSLRANEWKEQCSCEFHR
jgi:hypothetical protein